MEKGFLVFPKVKIEETFFETGTPLLFCINMDGWAMRFKDYDMLIILRIGWKKRTESKNKVYAY